jgi:bcr-type benzoyl-CoA reductase subunit C
MFERFHEVIGQVSQTVETYEKQLQRPVIGVMPAYFPLELIWAAGGYPVQLWGNNLPIQNADAYMQSYCCSVARSVLELELRGGADMVRAYAFTSLCDTLINTREIYRRLFSKPTVELSIPITRTTTARRQYLTTVVDTVLNQLSDITGKTVDAQDLREASEIYGHSRKLQRDLYALRRARPGLMKNSDFYAVIKSGFFLPAAEYNPLLESLLSQVYKLEPQPEPGPKLVVSGMVFDPVSMVSLFDQAGADIVDDDFANGWRYAVKPDLDVEDPVAGITEYLFENAPCCCIYNPDNDRHAYMVDKVRASDADGVVFWYIKFCEPDAFDRPQLVARLKEEGIPATTIDIELSMANTDAVETRIAAFCEILEG